MKLLLIQKTISQKFSFLADWDPIAWDQGPNAVSIWMSQMPEDFYPDADRNINLPIGKKLNENSKFI